MYISCCTRCKCNLRREVCQVFCHRYKLERDIRTGHELYAARSEQVLKAIKHGR